MKRKLYVIEDALLLIATGMALGFIALVAGGVFP